MRSVTRCAPWCSSTPHFPGPGYYAQRDFLNTLAGADGLLPPWTSWWEESDVAELFPDAEVQARVEAEQARMPLAYYDHLPPAPDGWDRPRCAYIWFAQPYEKGAEQASARGWPTLCRAKTSDRRWGALFVVPARARQWVCSVM